MWSTPSFAKKKRLWTAEFCFALWKSLTSIISVAADLVSRDQTLLLFAILSLSVEHQKCFPVLSSFEDWCLIYNEHWDALSSFVWWNNTAVPLPDGIDTHKRSLEIGFQSGIQKRNKDIVSWAKKKRKTIRRDDLLSYLSGRSPARRSPEVKSTSTSTHGSNGLVLQGGMEFDVDAGFRPQVDGFDVRAGMDTTPFFTAAGLSPVLNSRRRNYADTNLAEPELREGRKRSTCPADIVMESPSHKRTRYL